MTEVVRKCYCDRCKKEMPEPSSVGFKVCGRIMGVQQLTDEWHYIDLCDHCKESFTKWFRPKKFKGEIVELNFESDILAESEESE